SFVAHSDIQLDIKVVYLVLVSSVVFRSSAVKAVLVATTALQSAQITCTTFSTATSTRSRYPHRLLPVGSVTPLLQAHTGEKEIWFVWLVLGSLLLPTATIARVLELFVRKLEFASASALILALEFGVLHPHLLVGKLKACTATVGKLVISLFLFMVFLWDKDIRIFYIL
ncbi:hypothetical protein DVH24_030934, partial [Malus domestica]